MAPTSRAMRAATGSRKSLLDLVDSAWHLDHFHANAGATLTYVFEDRKLNRTLEPLPGQIFEEYAARTTSPVKIYAAHASPLGLVFYTGSQFPAEYRNEAFATIRGSWNRARPTGYKVVRVKFNQYGQPVDIQDFAGSWLTNNGQNHFGRLAGIAQHPDGSLPVADDANGIVYRIAYTGR